MVLATLLLAQAGLYSFRRDHHPDGIGKFYRGREIAQVMGHEGALWLDRPEREAEEGVSRLVKALDLKPGMIVADVGAGSGTISVPMARLVEPKGKVLAVEIQSEMLALIRKRARREGLTNIVAVLGATSDPRLPAGGVDLILMVDVYHELDKPYEMTDAMVKSLRKGGRLVLVEYRGEDPRVPIKELHKMTEAQVRRELTAFSLTFEKNDDRLPRQHILVFRKN